MRSESSLVSGRRRPGAGAAAAGLAAIAAAGPSGGRLSGPLAASWARRRRLVTRLPVSEIRRHGRRESNKLEAALIIV